MIFPLCLLSLYWRCAEFLKGANCVADITYIDKISVLNAATCLTVAAISTSSCVRLPCRSDGIFSSSFQLGLLSDVLMLASCPHLYVLSYLSVAVLQRCVNIHCLTFVLGLNREVEQLYAMCCCSPNMIPVIK